jgi:DNA polymerase III alpha subunit (gram-positive type)
VIAHNASFDQEAINIEANRLGRIIKWPTCRCSVEQTIHLKGKRLTLGALHEHLFGARFDDAHRARADVMALVRCCCELHKRGEL